MRKVFTAIEVPIDILSEFEQTSLVIQNQPHITLHFIGGISEEKLELLNQRLNSIPASSFEIEISGVGKFFNNSKSFLWAKVIPNIDLLNLHKEIGLSLKHFYLPIEEREYCPHITIAVTNDDELADNFLESHMNVQFKFKVNQFSTFQSEFVNGKPHYKRVYSYALQK